MEQSYMLWSWHANVCVRGREGEKDWTQETVSVVKVVLINIFYKKKYINLIQQFSEEG